MASEQTYRQAELFPDRPNWEVLEIDLEIAGVGIILYSPPAVAHIPEGSDYLREHFSHGKDVARHVRACRLTGFCTGSPGEFHLRFWQSPLNDAAVGGSAVTLRY